MQIYFRAFGLSWVVLLFVALSTEPHARSAEKLVSDSSLLSDEQLAAVLEQSCDLKLQDVTLRDALSRIAGHYKVPVRFRKRTYRTFDISLDQPASCGNSGSVRDVISQLLASQTRQTVSPAQICARQGAIEVLPEAPPAQPFLIPEGPEPFLKGSVVDSDGNTIPETVVEGRDGLASIFVPTDAGRFVMPFSGLNAWGTLIIADQRSTGRIAVSTAPDNLDQIDAFVLKVAPPKTIEVLVTDRDDKPISEARVGIMTTLQRYGGGRTDHDGRLRLQIPADLRVDTIYAWGHGRGLDYANYQDWRAHNDLKRSAPAQPEATVRLQLVGARTIALKFLDDNENPIANLPVCPWYFQKPGQPGDFNLSGISAEFTAVTDADGLVGFDWLPTWDESIVTFWPSSEEFAHNRVTVDQKQPIPDVVVVHQARLVELRGKVTDGEGNPASGASVSAHGAGYTFDDARGGTKSASDGSYTLKVPPDQIYLIVATSADGKSISTPRDGLIVRPNQPHEGVDFVLRPATRIYGRVTVGSGQQPVKEQSIQIYQQGIALQKLPEASLPNPEGSRRWVQPNLVRYVSTDTEGRYEFLVGPGQYNIRGPEQTEIQDFVVADERELEFNFHSQRSETGILKGRVVTGNPPQGVPDVTILGVIKSTRSNRRDPEAVTDAEGWFEFIRPLHPLSLYASTADKQLAGILEVRADAQEVTLAVALTARRTVRILSSDGTPFSEERKMIYGVRVHMGDQNAPSRWCYGRTVPLDADGRVEMTGLVAGAAYDIVLPNLDDHSYRTLKTILIEGDDEDLGDLKEPTPYKAPTFEERVEQAFQKPETASERNAAGLSDIRLSHQHVLITFADPDNPFVESLFKLIFESEASRKALQDYRTLAVPLIPEKALQAEELARSLGVDLPLDGAPLLVVESAEGQMIATLSAQELQPPAAGGEEPARVIDENKFVEFLAHHALPHLDARDVLATALAQAKADGKRVILQETATWCGPCWMLSRYLDKHRAQWEKDFLWIKIDERWTHADEVMAPIRNGASGGIPWVAILDHEGQVAATSNNAEGQNIGFPTDGPDIKHFLEMLTYSGQRMTPEDFDILKSALQE